MGERKRDTFVLCGEKKEGNEVVEGEVVQYSTFIEQY